MNPDAGTEEGFVCHVRDDAQQVTGWVAIDSTINGRASGGFRMLPDVTEPELQALARAMTLKYGLLGAHGGGAKAGLRIADEAPLEERRQALRRFGAAIRPLITTGMYLPAGDMGSDWDDIRALFEGAGLRLPARITLQDSGLYTGMTVVAGLATGLRAVGREPAGSTLAIEGFGKVGSSVARHFAKHGGKVVAVSTKLGALYAPAGLDVDLLFSLQAKHGSRLVEHYADADAIPASQIPELPVDALSPCARHGSVNASNAARVEARVVSPGANDPVTAEAEGILLSRDVICLPDFMTNSGGVLGTRLGVGGVDDAGIERFANERIGALLEDVIRKARASGSVPRDVARKRALARFAARKRKLESGPLRGIRARAVRGLVTGRVLPAGLTTRVALRYQTELLQGDDAH